SFPMLDAAWSHIPRRPSAGHAQRVSAGSRLPSVRGLSPWSWCAALVWPVCYRAGDTEIRFPRFRKAFLVATRSAVPLPGADVYAHSRERAVARSTRSEILGLRQP